MKLKDFLCKFNLELKEKSPYEDYELYGYAEESLGTFPVTVLNIDDKTKTIEILAHE